MGLFSTLSLSSDSLPLDEIIRRLARQPTVDGVLLMGSTAGDRMMPTSDYDLLVLLSELPMPLNLILTHIDHRLAEIYFMSAAELDRILQQAAAVSSESYAAAVVGWLRTGRIVWDRSGRLGKAQQTVRKDTLVRPPDLTTVYNTWFSINYNLQHTKWVLSSDDPVYQMKVDLRLLFSLSDLWTGYFRIRQIPWHGHKHSINYMMEHDPSYFALFQQCVATCDRHGRFTLYEELAERTLAPLGGLWPAGATAAEFSFPDGADFEPEVVNAGLALWEALIEAV